MKVIAVIYKLKDFKGKKKTYLIRKVFGYKDTSNKGRYRYEREGELSKFIEEKWCKNVIIIKRENFDIVKRILNKNRIPFERKDIEILD